MMMIIIIIIIIIIPNYNSYVTLRRKTLRYINFQVNKIKRCACGYIYREGFELMCIDLLIKVRPSFSQLICIDSFGGKETERIFNVEQ